MRRLFIILSILFISISFAAADTEGSPFNGKKIAYIINMAPSEIFEDAAEGACETALKLGITCSVYFTWGSDSKFISYVNSLASDGYDGLFLSHGGSSYSYALVNDVLERHPELRIVTFDTEFIDENGKRQEIDGVTQFFQDDRHLASILLDYLINELFPSQRPVRVIKVWVPDYIVAFDRREEGYRPYEESGLIQTVATVSPDTDASDAEQAAYEAMKELLQTISYDDFDAVWCAYDAYGRGVYRAMAEEKIDKPMVSVDLSKSDILMMMEKDSVWKASSCTDFTANGEQGVRLLALEIAGDYENIPSRYIEIPGALVTAEDIYLNGSGPVIESTDYGNRDNLVSSEFLTDLIGY